MLGYITEQAGHIPCTEVKTGNKLVSKWAYLMMVDRGRPSGLCLLAAGAATVRPQFCKMLGIAVRVGRVGVVPRIGKLAQS